VRPAASSGEGHRCGSTSDLAGKSSTTAIPPPPKRQPVDDAPQNLAILPSSLCLVLQPAGSVDKALSSVPLALGGSDRIEHARRRGSALALGLAITADRCALPTVTCCTAAARKCRGGDQTAVTLRTPGLALAGWWSLPTRFNAHKARH